MSEHAIRNTVKRKLSDDALVLSMGLRQARTPDIALIAAARADASRLRDVLEKTP